ncbi:MAG TPA: CapA family protein [Stellaceae bacterium]|jgi:poly-gamma-glutamate synthesis protein (capsule biosynthesis protein)|nr:CapA family protein [Stellaceae bacterium]
MASIILVGDVNLMNVDDPRVPFAQVGAEMRAADLVLANLECCLYQPPEGHTVEHEGFFADPGAAGEALKIGGIAAVGIANNVNYGNAAILGSIAQLDRIGIPHAGAGPNLDAARAPAIVIGGGLRIGFLQRSSVYWPTNHEASEHGAGIAVIRGHTAYQVPSHKIRPEIPPMNRPGVPPVVVTWADKVYLKRFADDIAALRRQADIVVASCHWGLGEEVLDYMTEIAHAAIDAGADIVIGHGPHYSLPVEVYRGKPIFYGLGSFSFHTGHGGRRHGDWIGMMAKIEAGNSGLGAVRFRFVRHNAANETVACALAAEGATLDRIVSNSAARNARLTTDGDWVRVAPPE